MYFSLLLVGLPLPKSKICYKLLTNSTYRIVFHAQSLRFQVNKKKCITKILVNILNHYLGYIYFTENYLHLYNS